MTAHKVIEMYLELLEEQSRLQAELAEKQQRITELEQQLAEATVAVPSEVRATIHAALTDIQEICRTSGYSQAKMDDLEAALAWLEQAGGVRDGKPSA